MQFYIDIWQSLLSKNGEREEDFVLVMYNLNLNLFAYMANMFCFLQ